MDNLTFDYDIFFPQQKMIAEKATARIAGSAEVAFDVSSEVNEAAVKDIEIEASSSDIDKWDYIAAACSAVLASAIDILWVKDLSLDSAQEWGQAEAEKMIKNMAQKRGYKGKDLDGAIRKLEELFKIPADGLMNDFGGGKQHHLRDFSHHASLLGLCCSLLTQFTGIGIGTDTAGKIILRKVKTDDYIGKTIPEKLFNGTVIWAFHLMSDLAGSSGSNGWGTGIPGPLLSFFKELSSLPIFNDIRVNYEGRETEFSVIVSKLFNGTFFSHETKGEIIRFDLRTEMGIFHQMTKQAVPVIANECLVRGFYAVRRFCLEVKKRNISSLIDLRRIDPKAFLPFNNRTVTRMITISSGSFMMIVTAEAAIKAAVKSKGSKAGFAVAFLLGINYPGIVRFVFACKADAKYISEDMQKALGEFMAKHKNSGKQQRTVAGLEYFALTGEQMIILQSLQRQKVLDDISLTKDKRQSEKKLEWYEKWRTLISKASEKPDMPFIEEAELGTAIQIEIEKNENLCWLYLIALELKLFTPYTPLSESDRKRYNGLSLRTKYEKTGFCSLQAIVTAKDIDALSSTYKRAMGTLNNTTEKVAIGAATTVGVTALTAGLAWAFAPGIAAAIAGEAVVGLHGAALASASLAFVGGGALAAGGLGVAGGTAIIVGGGALLGIAGSGAASVTTVLLLSSKQEILNECAKLMTVCKSVLIDKLNLPAIVETCAQEVSKGIDEQEVQISTIEAQIDSKESDMKALKSTLKDSKESLKYIKRCRDYLNKLTKKKK